ncbi:hypothetical protein HDU96_000897 [Phlyctochytrium bullatum]|nr:hypothetical protein HDU96_000897 [Phlyctochytrium bullatum]
MHPVAFTFTAPPPPSRVPTPTSTPPLAPSIPTKRVRIRHLPPPSPAAASAGGRTEWQYRRDADHHHPSPRSSPVLAAAPAPPVLSRVTAATAAAPVPVVEVAMGGGGALHESLRRWVPESPVGRPQRHAPPAAAEAAAGEASTLGNPPTTLMPNTLSLVGGLIDASLGLMLRLNQETQTEGLSVDVVVAENQTVAAGAGTSAMVTAAPLPTRGRVGVTVLDAAVWPASPRMAESGVSVTRPARSSPVPTRRAGTPVPRQPDMQEETTRSASPRMQENGVPLRPMRSSPVPARRGETTTTAAAPRQPDMQEESMPGRFLARPTASRRVEVMPAPMRREVLEGQVAQGPVRPWVRTGASRLVVLQEVRAEMPRGVARSQSPRLVAAEVDEGVGAGEQRQGREREEVASSIELEVGDGAAGGEAVLMKADGPTCAVCMTNPIKSVLVPCGHICICDVCVDKAEQESLRSTNTLRVHDERDDGDGRNMFQCPVCRRGVKGAIAFFVCGAESV